MTDVAAASVSTSTNQETKACLQQLKKNNHDIDTFLTWLPLTVLILTFVYNICSR